MPEDVSNGIFGQQDDSTRHAYQSGFVSSAKSPRDKFLHDNPEYGYGKGAMSADYDSRKSRLVDSIRERDFPLLRQREVSTTSNEACGLDQQGIVYLDHAGATLYSVTQLRGVMNELLGSLNGNPHSQGPVASATSARVESVRLAVLAHFGADPNEWSVVFTAGATAALKMVGEMFPWQRGSLFVHARNSHNSVLGIREYARENGAAVRCVDVDDPCRDSPTPEFKSEPYIERIGRDTPDGHSADGRGVPRRRRRDGNRVNRSVSSGARGGDKAVDDQTRRAGGDGVVDLPSDADPEPDPDVDPDASADGDADSDAVVDCLFAFPAECNATGVRPSLSICGRVKRLGQHLFSRPPVPRRSAAPRDCSSGSVGSTGLGVVQLTEHDGDEDEDDGARVGGDANGSSASGDGCDGQRAPPGPDPPGEGQPGARERWWVLLDAAKFVGTAPLDLAEVEADFVAVSFYKIFGFPTGLGALLVRESAAAVLRKRYFGGGTVLAALASSSFRRFRPETDRRLTDGTEDYMGIISLEKCVSIVHRGAGLRFLGKWDPVLTYHPNALLRQAGLRVVESVGGMQAIEAHTACLARDLHSRLSALRHGNGSPVLKCFGKWGHESASDGNLPPAPPVSTIAMPRKLAPADSCARMHGGQGPVLAMGFLGPGGEPVGHAEVEKLAGLDGIQIRTGCFCNSGACQSVLGLRDIDVVENFERGHVCWDEHDLVDGRPTGLVRVSLGWMSTWEDTSAFVSFVRRHFVVEEHQAQPGRDSRDRTLDAPAMAPRPLRQTSVRSRPSKAAETRSISNLDASAGLVDKNPELRDRSQHEEGRVLEAVYVYPIKSCAPQRARARERPVYRAQNSARREAGASTRTLVTVVVAGAGHGRSVPPPEVEEGRPCWPLGPTGLAYDREWAVVDRRNRALRLKQAPDMCKIQPFVDLRDRTLTVSAPGMPNLVLPLDWAKDGGNSTDPSKPGTASRDAVAAGPGSARERGAEAGTSRDATARARRSTDEPLGHGAAGRGGEHATIRVCGNRRRGVTCEASASAWFTRFLGVPCSLVRAASAISPEDDDDTQAERLDGVERAFANEAQFLLISRASVAKVNQIIRGSFSAEGVSQVEERDSRDGGSGTRDASKVVTTAHFRPNFVVGGVRAHEEDDWHHVLFGDRLRFRVTGPCSRCSMINIDPATGDSSGVALKVLAGYRRQRANILFGQFLARDLAFSPADDCRRHDLLARGEELGGVVHGDEVRGSGKGDVVEAPGVSGVSKIPAVGFDEWDDWVWEGMEVRAEV